MSETRRGSAAGSFDWEAAKSRLARAASSSLTTERSQQILDERARCLAKVPEEPPDASKILELLTFQLGEDAYGIETRYVLEVMRPREITPVPGVPSFLVGVTNLRGEVLAVLDIRFLWGSGALQDMENSSLIVLGSDRPEFGIVADIVHDVTTKRKKEILTPSTAVSEKGKQHLIGITAEALLIVDGQALLREPSLYVEQEV